MVILTNGMFGQTDATLYSFTGLTDGGNPLASLVMDTAGNLYGTTFVGGAFGDGEVFKLSPDGNGGWMQTVIYSFSGADGANPYYSDVIFDQAGNLYGTTVSGGAHNGGVVFELSPTNNGWTETVLYSFAGEPDGQNPYSGLIFDAKGNLYGTTYGGGSSNQLGTVYQLKRAGTGWKENVLYKFDGTTGTAPVGGLVMDARGNLYGTTQGGGAHRVGVVFTLRHSNGVWTEQILHSFSGGADGGYPYAERLILDKAGNLYGTTQGGGINNYGVVFRLSLTNSGWREKVLHSFDGTVESNPYSGLVMDAEGNLYGTCANGNGVTTVGSVYKLTRNGDSYSESDLHLFTRGDGEFPESGLLRDSAGNLYGTTLQGGTANMGVVFEVSK